jgi:hypothetical protein
MNQGQERRAAGLHRVPVEALVEICGRDSGGALAFEAESVDVSGRGMHVRTAYLPDVGAPLVCRFEHDGHDIVVEGVVAWRDEAERGGEFGIQFTALDSGSVDALRSLCRLEEERAEQQAAADSPPAPVAGPERGTRVRLHIDGLGSPMKACVRQGSQRRVDVSSNLEFLRVGRQLELEDLGNGGRRPARIHGVDVMVDPESQVPQLVVSLRYGDVEVDAQEHTPEPSVIDTAKQVAPRAPVASAALPTPSAPAPQVRGQARTTPELTEEEDLEGSPIAPAALADEGEMIEDAGRVGERLGAVAEGAGVAAKKTGAVLARASVGAAATLGKMFRGAGTLLSEYRQKKQGQAERPKRTTAAPPSGVLSVDGRRLRPQSRDAAAKQAAEKPPAAPSGKLSGLKGMSAKKKKVAGAAAAAVLVSSIAVIAFKKPAPPPGAESSEPAVSMTVAAESPASGDVTQVDEQGNPISAPPAAKQAAPAAAAKDEDPESGITADVPLFGPTPMATMEPAPLGAPPELDGVADEEAKEKEAAEKPEVADETWAEKSPEKPTTRVSPQDVKPWGRGRVNKPTIHRLRLDKPGAGIKGAVHATGFTVAVPDVKVMESPRGIERRDKRIVSVKTRNRSSGAEVTFRFRDAVPGYRVRLRKDFVEFLISAPSTSKKKKKKKG